MRVPRGTANARGAARDRGGIVSEKKSTTSHPILWSLVLLAAAAKVIDELRTVAGGFSELWGWIQAPLDAPFTIRGVFSWLLSMSTVGLVLSALLLIRAWKKEHERQSQAVAKALVEGAIAHVKKLDENAAAQREELLAIGAAQRADILAKVRPDERLEKLEQRINELTATVEKVKPPAP